MDKKLKILTNVFINTTKNNVVPVNIYFDDSIKKIEKLSSKEFNWEELNTIEKKNKLTAQISVPQLQFNAKKNDGNFNLLIPGAIDPHVHFDTPGFEFRDTFEHGSTAAAYGGVTTIIDMPCTSLPPVTSKENFSAKLDAVRNRSLIDFAFWGGVCRNDFEDFKDIEKQVLELNELGVAGYKTYLISGMETFKDLKLDQMRQVANFIKKTGKPQSVHAEDKFLVESRRLEFQSNNRNEWRHYCLSRDSLAEEKAIKDMIEIARKSGHKIHIVHLSSELGLNAIRQAQKEGVNITSETCPHYLHFTQDDFNNGDISNFLKTAPPVKMKNDQDALWDGLEDGSLLFLTTDHAGCNPADEKTSDNFWEVYGGIPGVEHRVSYLISEGFLKRKFTLDKTIDLLSTNVAEYFNLSRKGKIEEGYDADFALINLWEGERINSENMHSKGKYTPFESLQVQCKVEKTILRGGVIMDKEGKAEENIGYGKFLTIKS
ncbi:MAG: amidohydrolase family protein [Melioribacteraceae bacterium]|nr:amidohydrolase family protein [Melioribacteraceae bacterium]